MGTVICLLYHNQIMIDINELQYFAFSRLCTFYNNGENLFESKVKAVTNLSKPRYNFKILFDQ